MSSSTSDMPFWFAATCAHSLYYGLELLVYEALSY
jgi:hypothetical protein